MRSDLDRTLATAVLLLTAIAGWTVARASGILATQSRVLIYFLVNLVLMMDMIDLIVRLWITRRHGAAPRGPSIDLCLPEISKAELRLALRPYAIIAAVHDAADDIDRFITAMQPFKAHVWLIDDASNDDTLRRLRQSGWNCIAGGINRKKPSALFHLLRQLPPEVETVVVVDPDVKLSGAGDTHRDTLELVIGDFQRSEAAAVSPRISVHAHGWLAECQAFEYELSCGLGRKSLGDLSTNSGVSIYKRSRLDAVLAQHTLSVYAEDLENSVLLLAAGERIYYDDRLTFVTDAKRTLQGWFSQRVGWSFGWAKVFFERLPLFLTIARRGPLAAYQYLFYLGLNGVIALPVKIVSVAILAMSLLNGLGDLFATHLMPDRSWNEPVLFALWYVKTAVMLTVACVVALPRGERSPHLMTIPFYGLYAILHFAPMSVGFSNVLTLKLFGRRLYADHYDQNPQLLRWRTAAATQ